MDTNPGENDTDLDGVSEGDQLESLRTMSLAPGPAVQNQGAGPALDSADLDGDGDLDLPMRTVQGAIRLIL